MTFKDGTPLSVNTTDNEREDLYIVSDLHLGEGRSSESRRYSRLESFFYDREYANFVDRVLVETMARRRQARLILNGDVFDFLSMVRLPPQNIIREKGMQISGEEHKYGLGTSPEKSAWKLERIMRGHPLFFRAMLRFVHAGHPITITRGNHDQELFWQPVRDIFYSCLADMAQEEGLTTLSQEVLREKITFEQWFYYEPGRVYVEHGHQYEATNSNRFYLHPVLPQEFSENNEEVLDYPTGSLFVRFLFNKLKQVDPFSTLFVRFDHYLGLLGRASFLDMVRTITLHFPFFLQAIKGARFFELHGMEKIADVHESCLDEVAQEKELDRETIQALDELMVEPVGKTKYSLVQEMLRPVITTVLRVAGIAMLSLSAWFVLFTLIHSTGWITGVFMRATLLAILAVVTVVGLFFGIMTLYKRVSSTRNPWEDTFYRKGEKISELLSVPFVCMGHTHKTDLRPFRTGSGFYANSGTWIISAGPWDAVKPRSRQFTFVRILDMTIDIFRWEDTTSRWEPVPLMEDYVPSPLERLITEDESISE